MAKRNLYGFIYRCNICACHMIVSAVTTMKQKNWISSLWGIKDKSEEEYRLIEYSFTKGEYI